jgi:hypothetical protein
MKFAALVFFLLVVLLGCAGGANPRSGVSVGSSGEPVSVTIVPPREVRLQYGRSFDDNPFLSPKSLITRKSVEFIVLRLEVTGERELELLEADAVDESGAIWASFYTKRDFTELALFLSAPSMDNTTKRNKIDWYYLPSGKVRVRSGSHSYLLVLVGKPPFPESLTARVKLLLGTEELDFEVPVTMPETK